MVSLMYLANLELANSQFKCRVTVVVLTIIMYLAWSPFLHVVLAHLWLIGKCKCTYGGYVWSV